MKRNLETSSGCICFIPRGIFQVAKVFVQVWLQNPVSTTASNRDSNLATWLELPSNPDVQVQYNFLLDPTGFKH